MNKKRTATQETDFIDGLQALESNAWKELFEEYRLTLEKRASVVLGSSDADDHVQNVFLKAIEHIRQFDRRAAIGTWIYRISFNLLHDELRYGRRHPEHHSHEATLLLDQPDPVDHQGSVHASIELQRLLPLLQSEELEILILRTIDERTWPEIEEIMERPARTCGAIWTRAIKKLREGYSL